MLLAREELATKPSQVQKATVALYRLFLKLSHRFSALSANAAAGRKIQWVYNVLSWCRRHTIASLTALPLSQSSVTQAEH